jgi:hypothetical protein
LRPGVYPTDRSIFVELDVSPADRSTLAELRVCFRETFPFSARDRMLVCARPLASACDVQLVVRFVAHRMSFESEHNCGEHTTADPAWAAELPGALRRDRPPGRTPGAGVSGRGGAQRRRLDVVAAALVFTWLNLGWPGLIALVLLVVAGLAALRLLRPDWFTRLVSGPARNRWRWWFYRRRWQAAMTLAGLAPTYRSRALVPVLARVRASGAVDLVTVRLVTGQAPADFADRAENLAHAFGAELCRVRDCGPGAVLLEFVRADTLADPIPALPVSPDVDLATLPVGWCENSAPWLLRLLGSHVLIAGATGSGKGSVIWSAIRAIRALLPAMLGGRGRHHCGASARPWPIHGVRVGSPR